MCLNIYELPSTPRVHLEEDAVPLCAFQSVSRNPPILPVQAYRQVFRRFVSQGAFREPHPSHLSDRMTAGKLCVLDAPGG